jgi:hypothetical protein
MPTTEDLQAFPSDKQPPLSEVIAEFEQELSLGHTREAAELAYAVAVRRQAEGRVRDAAEYGKQCLSLLESIPSKTIEQVTSTRMKAGGVSLPELLHEGVVRARLGHLLES